MKRTIHRFLSVFLSLCIIVSYIPGLSLTAYATCYNTGESSYMVDYSADGTNVNSIVINFVYGDDAHKTSGEGSIGQSWSAQYNIIFTTDQTKTQQDSVWLDPADWNDFDNSGIIGTAQTVQATLIAQNETFGKMEGTYTLNDSTVLGQLQSDTQYYGLLCAAWGTGKWYTGEFVPVKLEPKTVTFNANGGFPAPAAQCVNKGGYATVPAEPTKDGYDFGGWYTDSGLTVPADFSAAITSNVTYYAKWESLAPAVAAVNGIEYTDFNTALANWTSGSTLTLLGDVTTSSTISVSGTKTLDLNGYGIRMTGSGSVISVGNGAYLTLNDSDTSKTHKYTVSSPKSNGSGLATVDDTNGTQSFSGGYITGGNAGSGGGVAVNGGTFNMTGGTIIGNRSTSNGGGISVYGNAAFEMTSGALIGNTAAYGGGIGSIAQNNATITITLSGGVIAYNKSTGTGGGVHGNGNEGGLASINMTITGTVTIENNHTDGDWNSINAGGGVVVDGSRYFLMLSGSPTISGNTAGNGTSRSVVDNNVFFTNRGNPKAIISEFSPVVPVGVTMWIPGVFTNSATTANDDASKFTSDNSAYIVGKNAEGQLFLGTPVTVTIDPDNGSSATEQTVASGSVITEPEEPAKDGFTFDGWYNGDTEFDFDNDTVTSDITLTAKWKNSHTHTWSYNTTNAAITAICTGDGQCDLTSEPTLTIVAPQPSAGQTALNYDGGAKAATLDGLDDFNTATGLTVTLDSITYSGTLSDGTAYPESTTAPTNAGSYTASITVEGATASVNFEISKIFPNVSAPTGLTAAYGQTLEDISLPTGWAWQFPEQSVGNAGDNQFKADYTPEDTVNYYEAAGFDVTVTVGKVAPEYTAPQAITGLYYDTMPQELVTVGYTDDGNILYSLNGTDYSDSVPTGTTAGSYTVYWKVQGDNNHTDTEVFTISVGIISIDPTIGAPTAIQGLRYTGTAQTLVTAGTTDGGTMMYSVDGGDYSPEVPTGTDARNYVVSYYIEGDDNYNTTDPQMLNVSIGKADKAAPVLTSENETAAGKGDGKINGFAEGMQISTTGQEDDYEDITDFSGENYTAGTYYIRYAETDNYLASPAVMVTIEAGPQVTINFDTDGGTQIPAITGNYGTAVTAPKDPIKELAKFDGWDKEIPETIPAENMTITAKWIPLTEVPAVPADCENSGMKLYYKDDKGNIYADKHGLNPTTIEELTVPAKGHTAGAPVQENVVSPTVDRSGSYDEVVYCSVCGEELSRDMMTIPAGGYTPASGPSSPYIPPTTDEQTSDATDTSVVTEDSSDETTVSSEEAVVVTVNDDTDKDNEDSSDETTVSSEEADIASVNDDTDKDNDTTNPAKPDNAAYDDDTDNDDHTSKRGNTDGDDITGSDDDTINSADTNDTDETYKPESDGKDNISDNDTTGGTVSDSDDNSSNNGTIGSIKSDNESLENDTESSLNAENSSDHKDTNENKIEGDTAVPPNSDNNIFEGVETLEEAKKIAVEKAMDMVHDCDGKEIQMIIERFCEKVEDGSVQTIEELEDMFRDLSYEVEVQKKVQSAKLNIQSEIDSIEKNLNYTPDSLDILKEKYTELIGELEKCSSDEEVERIIEQWENSMSQLRVFRLETKDGICCFVTNEGGFRADASLSVQSSELRETERKMIDKYLAENHYSVISFIDVDVENNDVWSESSVTVKLPDNAPVGGKYTVITIGEDGEIKYLDAKYNIDGTITFMTDRFSRMAIAGKKGISIWFGIFVFLFIALISYFLLLLGEREKKEKEVLCYG